MHSGVPQGRLLGPFLYTLYMADIPQSPNTTLSTFTDDTAIVSNHSNPITASANLKTHLQSTEKWWFCVTMSTAGLNSLSTVCQYLTMYRLMVLCHYVHCWPQQSVHCLSIPHNVPSDGSVSLCPLLSSTVYPLSVRTSQCTVCWFWGHYVHSWLLQFTHCLSVPHTVPSVGFVSLCPLLSSTVCPLSVNISHSRVCWFCVTSSTAVFYSLSNVCQYLTLYRLLILCHLFHCCLLKSVHWLSTSRRTVCFFCVTLATAVFYSLSTVCNYLTLFRLLVL